VYFFRPSNDVQVAPLSHESELIADAAATRRPHIAIPVDKGITAAQWFKKRQTMWRTDSNKVGGSLVRDHSKAHWSLFRASSLISQQVGGIRLPSSWVCIGNATILKPSSLLITPLPVGIIAYGEKEFECALWHSFRVETRCSHLAWVSSTWMLYERHGLTIAWCRYTMKEPSMTILELYFSFHDDCALFKAMYSHSCSELRNRAQTPGHLEAAAVRRRSRVVLIFLSVLPCLDTRGASFPEVLFPIVRVVVCPLPPTFWPDDGGREAGLSSAP